MQRKVLADRVDVVEIEPALELMRPGEIADGVEHLVAHVLARLRRKSLAPHARDAEHFQRRPALILERADGVRALRVEGVHCLIAVGYLETGFVDHLRRADPQMRQREHQVVALEHGSAAARHVAAERLDVLVQVARPVDARRQRTDSGSAGDRFFREPDSSGCRTARAPSRPGSRRAARICAGVP